MCNRFRAIGREALMRYAEEELGIDWGPERPRFNIAPNTLQTIFVKCEADKLTAMDALWNLIPSFEAVPGKSFLRTNARPEEVLTKRSYREPVQNSRCLVPADGFYEWEHIPGGKMKLPWVFELKSKRPFTFAGWWERGGENKPPSFTILTTSPNELVRKIHDRMPVMLSNENARRWLTSGSLTPETLAPFVRPYPADLMESHRVNRALNSVRNDTPEAAAPAPTDEGRPLAAPPLAQGELF